MKIFLTLLILGSVINGQVYAKSSVLFNPSQVQKIQQWIKDYEAEKSKQKKDQYLVRALDEAKEHQQLLQLFPETQGMVKDIQELRGHLAKNSVKQHQVVLNRLKKNIQTFIETH